MLHSLCSENSGEQFEVHFLHDQRDPTSKWDSLAQIADEFGAQWSPHGIAVDKLAGLPFAAGYGGYAASYRLLIPELLPDVNRVLYLDADTLILDRIRPLWDIELGDCCVAAVTNPLYRHMEWRLRDQLGMPDRRAYFNSGVMLLDLQGLRQRGLDRALVDYARDHSTHVQWPDQDVLNAVLWRHRLPLHPRWNATGSLWSLPRRDLPWAPEEITEARIFPAIAHFLGPYKANHFRNQHPRKAQYFQHLEMTRFRGQPIEGRTAKHVLLKPLPALLQWTLENGSLELRVELAHRLRHSTLGTLARDLYRWRTPDPARNPISLVLEALSQSVKQVFFVQVGSNDGDHDDPLRPYILSDHWRGLMVEPVPYVFQRLQANYRSRPGLILINAAIGPRDGVADFFSVAESSEDLPDWYDQIGSWSMEHILKHEGSIPGLRDRIVSLSVPSLTFESLCDTHQVGHIDLVHIDAEGYDFEIIKSIDLARHKPLLVMYEHKHLTRDENGLCRQHLRQHGYDILDVGWDTLAVRQDVVKLPWTRLGRSWRLARRAGRGT
jgi:FkbM family methyltransferase